MMEIITRIVIFLTGSMIGALWIRFALHLIARREGRKEAPRSDIIYCMTDVPVKSENTKNRILAGIVMLLNGSGWLYAVMVYGYSLRTVQFIIILSAAMVISIIDINARIIPNTLVLFLLLFSVLFSVFGTENQPLLLHLLGLAVTVVLFCIPLVLTKTVGSGDIKYLAVMGFCLGYPDAIKAIMLFSAILFGWLIFLLVSKKGGLHTKLALGPFISLGFVTTLLL